MGLALVDGLETLTSEHIDLLGGEIGFEQTAELQFLLVAIPTSRIFQACTASYYYKPPALLYERKRPCGRLQSFLPVLLYMVETQREDL